jgi:Legume lectin domain/PQQ enzyme repeat
MLSFSPVVVTRLRRRPVLGETGALHHRHIHVWSLLAMLILFGRSAGGQVNVPTRSYDNFRTGANLKENILTPANVNSSQFGKLFAFTADSEIYAQPLYVSNLNIGGSSRNVVFIATMNNSLYAIDADTGQELWSRTYGPPINSNAVQSAPNIAYQAGVGILSTPVIDLSTGLMYLVDGEQHTGSEGSPTYMFYLRAVNILTGVEPLAGTAIRPTYQTADLSSPMTFDPGVQNQRPSLALANGNVYVAFASHNDNGQYHGWVVAYSASTLAQTAAYSDTTIDTKGGIWMAGSAPAIDSAGYVFISTGNGNFGATPNNLIETGNSFIRLSPELVLKDYFTPTNSATLNASDQDLGSSGLLLVPDPADTTGTTTKFVVGGGKQGLLYVTNPGNLGKFNSSQDNVLQEFQAIYGYGTSHIHGTPPYFNSAANGPTLYVWGENDYLRGYNFNGSGGLLNTTPFATSTMTAPTAHISGAMPGGFLSISANGGTNGILWASTPYLANANSAVVQGVLYAFDADTLQLLWSDKQNDSRDEVGLFAKYVPPVVANGKMYVPTFGPLANGTTANVGQLVVYGLLATPTEQANYSTGFSATDLQLNQGATLNGSRLQLTDGGNYEARSAFFTSPVNVAKFTTSFQFQLSDPGGDGFTFTIQGNNPKSVGADAGNLGYGTIGRSVAIKFDLYSNAGEGPDSTGLYENGVLPTVSAIDLSSTGINLHSGDIFNAQLTYDGNTLTVGLTDTATRAAAMQSYKVDIPSLVGGSTAYAGFTASTGGTSSVQEILSWSYAGGKN